MQPTPGANGLSRRWRLLILGGLALAVLALGLHFLFRAISSHREAEIAARESREIDPARRAFKDDLAMPGKIGSVSRPGNLDLPTIRGGHDLDISEATESAGAPSPQARRGSGASDIARSRTRSETDAELRAFLAGAEDRAAAILKAGGAPGGSPPPSQPNAPRPDPKRAANWNSGGAAGASEQAGAGETEAQARSSQQIVSPAAILFGKFTIPERRQILSHLDDGQGIRSACKSSGLAQKCDSAQKDCMQVEKCARWLSTHLREEQGAQAQGGPVSTAGTPGSGPGASSSSLAASAGPAEGGEKAPAGAPPSGPTTASVANKEPPQAKPAAPTPPPTLFFEEPPSPPGFPLRPQPSPSETRPPSPSPTPFPVFEEPPSPGGFPPRR